MGGYIQLNIKNIQESKNQILEDIYGKVIDLFFEVNAYRSRFNGYLPKDIESTLFSIRRLSADIFCYRYDKPISEASRIKDMERELNRAVRSNWRLEERIEALKRRLEKKRTSERKKRRRDDIDSYYPLFPIEMLSG